MSLKIKYKKKADYLVANFSGEANLAEIGNLFRGAGRPLPGCEKKPAADEYFRN